jgi:membrane-bound lytic murein transglycosylase D
VKRNSVGMRVLLMTQLALALVMFVPGCTAKRDSAKALPLTDPAGNEAASGSSATDPIPTDAPLLNTSVDAGPEWANEATLDARAETADLASEAEPEPEPEPLIDPATLVAEVLEAAESARWVWEQGDIDGALATLDQAYGLLLELPDDDPDIDQEKQNLRHLISRSVVEIYRSRLTSAVEPGSPIPLDINEHIEREIKSFQGPERRFFLESYRRSGEYRPMITRMLRESGLPEELSWLPLVESGFKTKALSRARALGMWQFISSTGYRYGLSRSHWIDKRMDPEDATRGAIGYLTELHGMFGDWMTALAGYNCGEHRVMSVIRRQQDEHFDHFWDVFEQLPRETARYVPRFLATLLIVRDPGKYDFELPEPLPPVVFEKVAVQRHARLADLDRVLELDKGTLAALNPELRRGVTPAEAYELNVPPTAAPAFSIRLAELAAYVPPKDSFTTHRVRSGETLSTIARRHGSSINAIVAANNLRSRNRIRAGQRLKIPHRGASVRTVASSVQDGKSTSSVHTVRRGDSLWKLASRYGTTVDRLKRDNSLRSDRLTVGQKLRVNSGIPAGSRTYAVRRGDTIGKIARAHRVSLDAVLHTNGLSRSSTIHPGQLLIIPN